MYSRRGERESLGDPRQCTWLCILAVGDATHTVQDRAGLAACGGAANGVDDGASKRARAREPREAPRWYVTESELAAVSSYMRGRLTLDKVRACTPDPEVTVGPRALAGFLARIPCWASRHSWCAHAPWGLQGAEGSAWQRRVLSAAVTAYGSPGACSDTAYVQVNAALDEVAGHAATNLRTMAAVRNTAGGGGAGAAKLAPAERKRATDLLHGVAVSRVGGKLLCRTRAVHLCRNGSSRSTSALVHDKRSAGKLQGPFPCGMAAPVCISAYP